MNATVVCCTKKEYVQNKNYILKKRNTITNNSNSIPLFVISMKANDKNSHCQSFFYTWNTKSYIWSTKYLKCSKILSKTYRKRKNTK